MSENNEENKVEHLKLARVIILLIIALFIFIIYHNFGSISCVYAKCIDFLFFSGKISEDEPYKKLVFAFSCSLCSLIVFFLDLCVFNLSGKSILEKNRKNKAIKNFIITLMAPAMLGFFGTSLEVIQYSIAGVISVSLGWSFLLGLLFNIKVGLTDTADKN